LIDGCLLVLGDHKGKLIKVRISILPFLRVVRLGPFRSLHLRAVMTLGCSTGVLHNRHDGFGVALNGEGHAGEMLPVMNCLW
jgi:hypothetical protein